MYVTDRLWFPRFSWHTDAISWMSRELWDKRERSAQCRETCLFVLNEVWSHSTRFILSCALCRRRIKFLDVSVLSYGQVFQHGHRMGWVSLAPSFFSLSSFLSLCYCWCHSLFSWVTLNSHRCRRKRTSVVRCSYFVCPTSPSFCFWCRYFGDVPSRYDVAKGSISFGAAHLRFCSAWFASASVVFSLWPRSFCVFSF